jgi:hypothetical protein
MMSNYHDPSSNAWNSEPKLDALRAGTIAGYKPIKKIERIAAGYRFVASCSTDSKT